MKKQKNIDSLFFKSKKSDFLDLPLALFAKEYENSSVLFSKWGKTENFTTKNLELHHIRSSKKPDFRSLDGFLRYEKRLPIWEAFKLRREIYFQIKRKYSSHKRYFQEVLQNPFQEFSAVKMWNLSIVGALIFGMFIMTFIYRYLGQNVSALEQVSSSQEMMDLKQGEVLGASEKEKRAEASDDYVAKIENHYESKKRISENIEKMVKGYPIEKMIPYIADQDEKVAAFLVSIAKKESNWGKRVPVLDGKDCFNYWGYRGIRKRMGTGGHTCFDSREDAVKTVAKRLQNIIEKEKISTPEKMVTVWKCGYDCSWDDPSAVKKWASDVRGYFDAILKK